MIYRILAWLALGASVVAAVSHETLERDGKEIVALENDLYRLEFEPGNGGRCSSFRIKADDRELVYEGKTGGFFQDHFAHQYYPGELLNAAYEYAVTEDDASVSIRLWTVATGWRDGADTLTKGVEVSKAITLRAGRRDIEIVNAFHNPTDTGKNVGMWIQQCFAYGGDRLYDLYYRPSTHGIHLAGLDDTGHHPYTPGVDAYSTDFVGKCKYTDAGGREPVAGWTAGRDRRNNEGGIFLVDYNYLDVLYNSSSSFTTEWWLDPVPLPPGKSWSTTYWFVPVKGFTGFSHADRTLIANTEVLAAAGTVRLKHQFGGTVEPVGDLTVQTTIYGVRSHEEATLPPLTVTGVGTAPTDASQAWAQPQTEPLVVRVTVTGADWQRQYEVVHLGEFAGTGIHGAGQQAEYEVPRPAKQKEFLKPDSWERPTNEHPRVLVVYGLFTNHYGIEDAIQALYPQAEVTISTGWESFPPTYDTLLGYDAVVLSNVPAGPDYANVMVADVVREAGLGLLCLGGVSTYGGGQWRETALMDVFPATLETAFDFQPTGQGVYPTVTAAHPTVAGLEFPAAARIWWAHDVTPKAGATVLLTGGDRPLAIGAAAGKGRVLAVTASCFGEPDAGEIEAWTTDAWQTFLRNSLTWLTGRN